MPVPDRDVRIFADFERADAILNAELNRRIDRDESQRLFFGQVAPVHRLRGFDIQPSRALVGIRIHRNDNARASHDRGVVRNRVVSLDLIGPGIGEDLVARAVRGDLFRDLVAFERVLERPDLKTKLVREIDQHQDLADDVAVSVHVTLAFEHFDERLELQIASRRYEVLVFANVGAILVPRALVIARADERVANRLFDAHTRVWIAALDAGHVRRTRTLDVFAERELDARHRARKDEL